MKIDLYTKCVLTVIAVCLSLIVLRDVPMLEQAEASETKSNVQDVRIVGIHRHLVVRQVERVVLVAGHAIRDPPADGVDGCP